MMKKLTAVIVFWIFVISCCFSPALYPFLENTSVSAAENRACVPYVFNKGVWGLSQTGLRIHIENEDELVYENRYIDILRSSPNGNGGDFQEVSQNHESWINNNGSNAYRHVLWGDNPPYKIYVWSSFEAVLCDAYTEGLLEINNSISDIILRKYSSGESNNIWRMLDVDADTQNELVENGYYLVVEPLTWFYIPYTGNYNLNASNSGPFYSYFVYGTMRELLEYSGSARVTDGNFYKNHRGVAMTSDIEQFQLFSGRRTYDLSNGNSYATVAANRSGSYAYNMLGDYSLNYDGYLGEYMCVEAWSILYMMALSTRSYNNAWQVEECFKKYIRWYGNDYLFDDASDTSQLWYALRFATNSDDSIDYSRYRRYSNGDYAYSVEHAATPDHIAPLYDELIGSKFYKINCKTDILVNYINGPYRTDSEVYTTVTLKNISRNDINIGDIEAVFSADGYDVQPLDEDGLRAYHTNIIAPQETAYVSLKWRTPQSEYDNMHFTVDISQSGNDETAVVISPVEFDVEIKNMPSYDDYRSLENADHVNLDNISDIDRMIKQKYEAVYSSEYYEGQLQNNLDIWKQKYGLDDENEYNLSAGSFSIGNSFKKENNDENLSIDFHSNYPVGISSFILEESTLSNGDTIKSGYGLAFHLDYFGFNDYMTYNSAKLVFLYPEYGYDMNYAAVTEFIEGEGQECKYWLMSNPVSLYDSTEMASRIHFIPEWWPDDMNYTVYWAFIDTWTPAGQISTWGKLDFDIDGSVYDDWYITRNMS